MMHDMMGGGMMWGMGLFGLVALVVRSSLSPLSSNMSSSGEVRHDQDIHVDDLRARQLRRRTRRDPGRAAR